jgi:AcrR family transcriptional regulator
MVAILDAAADVFAERGYEPATTNAIAAKAGMSPGSLYQFFGNKEAIAAALAERFVARMHASGFDTIDVTGLSLAELLDRIIDPLVTFNVANPGLKTLFASTDTPEKLAAATLPLHRVVSSRVEAIVAACAPGLSATDQARCALVALQIAKGMIPPIVSATGQEREALVAELKKALHGYLTQANV